MLTKSKLTLYYDQFCECDQPKADLVCVHGWGMNSLVWDKLMPLLLKRYRVTLIELPGMGRSPVPAGNYSLDYVAEHLLKVAPERAVWLGWSLGGLVSLRAAQLATERIAALITIATNPCFVSKGEWPGTEARSLARFGEWLEEDWQGSLVRFLALQCKGSVQQRDDIRFLQERLFHHGLPARQALSNGLKLLAESDLRHAMASLSVPLLSLTGEFDELVPGAVSDAVAQLSENIESVTVQGAAHIPFLSHPHESFELIDRFIHKRVL